MDTVDEMDVKGEPESDEDPPILEDMVSVSMGQPRGEQQSDPQIKRRVSRMAKIREFPCLSCSKIFSSQKQLTIHIRVHTNERPFKCTECGNGFKQRSALAAHLITHSGKKEFQCEECNGSFTTSSSLKRHVKKIHVTGKSLECTRCSETFFNNSALNTHRYQAHAEALLLLDMQLCPHCNKTLSNPKSLKRHIKNLHPNQETEQGPKRGPKNGAHKYVRHCALCGAKISNFKLFVKHNNEHLQYTKSDVIDSRREGRYPCKQCDKVFTTRYALLSHVDDHLEKSHKCNICLEDFTYSALSQHTKYQHLKFECDVCDEVFTGNSRLAQHRRVAHKIFHKKYTCAVCKKEFSIRQNYNMHMLREHPTSTTYNCKGCARTFFSKAFLNAHLSRCSKVQHKIFTCSLCDKTYKRSDNLNRHNRKHHSTAAPDVFVNHCSKKFHSRAAVSSHVPTHGRQKAFKCKMCSSGFSTKSNFQKHIGSIRCLWTSPGPKFKCEICDQVYLKHYLKVHLTIHLGDSKKCRFCGIAFKNLRLLKHHMDRIHPAEDPYYCEKCALTFETDAELRVHRQSVEHRAEIKHILKKFITVRDEVPAECEEVIKFEFVEAKVKIEEGD